jgi:hypothetical protein
MIGTIYTIVTIGRICTIDMIGTIGRMGTITRMSMIGSIDPDGSDMTRWPRTEFWHHRIGMSMIVRTTLKRTVGETVVSRIVVNGSISFFCSRGSATHNIRNTVSHIRR